MTVRFKGWQEQSKFPLRVWLEKSDIRYVFALWTDASRRKTFVAVCRSTNTIAMYNTITIR